MSFREIAVTIRAVNRASAEYNVDAGTQTLETVLELGREAPLLADYVYALRSKTDSLSRYKLARA